MIGNGCMIATLSLQYARAGQWFTLLSSGNGYEELYLVVI